MSKKVLNEESKTSFLNTPLCQLDLQFKGSLVEECLKKVQDELKEKGLNFRFHYWISDDWFCPDGISGIAIPFYLLNSKIEKLEKEYVGQVEGKTKSECLKLIRHEVGHAIDNAFNLRECSIRKELFGDSNLRYPKEYIRKPFSKNYVKHLSENYAQAHPDEDWAETFAVWLTPNSEWKQKYSNWKAIEKLNYLDQVMNSLRGKKAKCLCRDTIDEIETLGITLKTYLNRKSKLKRKYQTPIFNSSIKKLFSTGRKSNALNFINANEKELCLKVAKNTNQYHYIVRDVLKELKSECRKNQLTLKRPVRETRTLLINLLSRSTVLYVKQGKNKVVM
ncbi:putative zinc-binding metallopeptidase [Halobacteriovorax sp.]|uniref:putative zinc-binding metallopeptidase n=1 Tax=Halobacteriovorax sp. TaxID=2020862 RepID=UPI0035622EA3